MTVYPSLKPQSHRHNYHQSPKFKLRHCPNQRPQWSRCQKLSHQPNKNIKCNTLLRPKHSPNHPQKFKWDHRLEVNHRLKPKSRLMSRLGHRCHKPSLKLSLHHNLSSYHPRLICSPRSMFFLGLYLSHQTCVLHPRLWPRHLPKPIRKHMLRHKPWPEMALKRPSTVYRSISVKP